MAATLSCFLPFRPLKYPNLSSTSSFVPTPLQLPSIAPPFFNLRSPAFPSLIEAKIKMVGRVVCDTNDKTVNVEVVRQRLYPKYHVWIKKRKKFQAHDPENKFKVGDMVQIVQCRPISKKKHFLAVPCSFIPKKNPSPAVPIDIRTYQHESKSSS